MERFKNIIVSVILIITMVSGMVTAYAIDIGEVVMSEEEIVPGVNHTYIRKMTTDGMLDINVVSCDLTNPYLKLELLTDEEGISHLSTTTNLAKGEDGVVAAVNADFFAWAKGLSGRGSSVGPVVEDGEVLSTSGTEEGMQTVVACKDGNFLWGALSFSITVTNENGDSAPVKAINKYDDLAQIMMYTSAFAKQTLGSGGGVVEVIVEDDIVTAINLEEGPVDIPENGYVLSSIIENKFLTENLAVGDKVTIDMKATFNDEEIDLSEADFAVGGGALLVKDGKIPETFTHNITGLNPRSGMGIDKNGTTVYLVTVDGRSSSSIGISQRDFAELMFEIGAYNAIAFDGGGSTTLSTEQDGEISAVNNPSEGSERPVANAVGVVSSSKPTGNVTRIDFEFADKNVFNGTSVKLTAYGYDEYGYKQILSPDIITWECSGEGDGYMSAGGYFNADVPGEATLQATYGEYSAKQNITVLDKVNYLEAQNEQITMKKGETVTLLLNGWDINSNRANIFIKDAKVSVSENIGTLSGNEFTATKEGTTLITVKVGEAECVYSIGVDCKPSDNYKKSTMVEDDYKTDKASYKSKFIVFGNTGTNRTAMDRFMINKSMLHLEKNESTSTLCAFVGETVDKDVLGELKMKRFLGIGYTSYTEGNNTYIQLDNPSYSLSKTSGQWTFLKTTLESLESDNVFIFMDRQKLTSDYETKLFYQLMDKYLLSKNKNVWIFSYDDEITSKYTDGIHYVTINGINENMKAKNYSMWTGSLKYLVVYVDGSDVKYSVKTIM